MEQLEAPIDHLFLDHELNDGLGNHFVELGAVLGTHFLQNSNLKPLSNRSILLLFENLNDFFKYLKIHFAWLRMCNILNSLCRAHNHREKGTQGVFEAVVVHIEHLHYEFHAFELRDFENVDGDYLLYEVASLVWWDLQSVHPET